MRKNISFAIAATMLGLAMIFFAKSSVVATSADMVRPNVGMSHAAMPASILPVRALEPTW
jgi:hypothetical protein